MKEERNSYINYIDDLLYCYYSLAKQRIKEIRTREPTNDEIKASFQAYKNIRIVGASEASLSKQGELIEDFKRTHVIIEENGYWRIVVKCSNQS